VIAFTAPTLILAILIAQAGPTPPAASPPPVPTAPATVAATPIAFTYVVNFPPTAPGTPGIREAALTEQTLHSGGPWAIRVTTTTDIASVSLEAFGMHVAIYRVGESGSGVFGAIGTLPDAPSSYLNRTYTVNVVGTTADGRQATAPITVRLVR
jgi:hypothetical protein